MSAQREINLPEFAQKLLPPARYKIIKGGRGSAKSHTVGRLLLLFAAQRKIRVLCGREFQNSMKESVHKLLSILIEEMELPGFEIIRDTISHRNGSEFIFKGIRNNIESIKSMEAIDYLWLEEADKVSQYSWDTLIPTIRKERSEIWCVYNPDSESDPVHKMFFVDTPPSSSICLSVSWRDNPWFPDVLKKEKDYLFKVDPERAMHVWEGQCRSYSDAQVFKGKWTVDLFDPQKSWQGPYFGADWGFSNDPSTLVKSYIYQNCLYIYEEWGEVGVDIKDLPACFDTVSESRKHLIMGDCARPETISHITQSGFMIEAAPKWAGSVEQGISWLRSFEKIIIHPQCPKTAAEFKNYSFKIDRVTQKVTTTLIDKDNHYIDAIRYSYAHLIKETNGEMSEDMAILDEDYEGLGDW